MRAETFWTTAQQIRIARRMLDLVLLDGLSELEALRKAALESPKPRSIKTKAQVELLKKGFLFARLEVKRLIEAGSYFKPQVVEVNDMLSPDHPLGAHVAGVEKVTRDFVPQERKPYVLVVGIMQGQVRHLSSDKYDIRFWQIGSSYNQLEQLSRGARHTLMWTNMVNHVVSDRLKVSGAKTIPVNGGLSSIQRKLSQLN